MSVDKQYGIIGGGLVGSLLAVMLAKRGLSVDLWERRPDIRTAKLLAGRSINLALSNRGLRALSLIGLEEQARQICLPMYGREVHDESGATRFMPYGKPGEAINSVSRGGLNQMLLQYADGFDNIRMHFDERCEDAHLPSGEISFVNTQSGEHSKQKYDVIFGTDGAFSALRTAMMKTDRFDFSYNQAYIAHDYKELHIPAGSDGAFLLSKEALHIWPRKSFMMIALPNIDGSFTCTLFLARKGEVSFDHLHTAEEVQVFFDRYFADVVPLMPDLVSDFMRNPQASLVTIQCEPWNYGGSATLLGDAAHPIVPFYGQGMNAGFEDCTHLYHLMEKEGEDWDTILPALNNERKPNGDAVGELALQNFVEMRDLVADPEFILKNRINRKMEELFPEQWTTLYRMVTFAETPYQEAWTKGKAHEQVLDRIVREVEGISEMLDSHDLVKPVLEKYLA